MKTTEYISLGLETSRNLVLPLLDDMQNAPLQAPTSKGGNHPLWILGHLTYAESNIVEHMILGRDNPLLSWKVPFGARQEPSTNIADYPGWHQVRDKYDAVRRNTLAYLQGITDTDLEKPSINFPPGREAFFGTIGRCMNMLTIHTMMHFGQVADARRMADRPPLNG